MNSAESRCAVRLSLFARLGRARLPKTLYGRPVSDVNKPEPFGRCLGFRIAPTVVIQDGFRSSLSVDKETFYVEKAAASRSSQLFPLTRAAFSGDRRSIPEHELCSPAERAERTERGLPGRNDRG